MIEKAVHVMMFTGKFMTETLRQLTQALTDLTKLMPEKRLSFWILINAGLHHSYYDVRMNSIDFLPKLVKIIPSKKYEFWSSCVNMLFTENDIIFNALDALHNLTIQFPIEFSDQFVKLIRSIPIFPLYNLFSSPIFYSWVHPEAKLEIIKLIASENSTASDRIFCHSNKLVDFATECPKLAANYLSIIKRNFDDFDIDIRINAMINFSKIKKIALSYSNLKSETIDPEYWREISTIIYQILNNEFLENRSKDLISLTQ